MPTSDDLTEEEGQNLKSPHVTCGRLTCNPRRDDVARTVLRPSAPLLSLVPYCTCTYTCRRRRRRLVRLDASRRSFPFLDATRRVVVVVLRRRRLRRRRCH